MPPKKAAKSAATATAASGRPRRETATEKTTTTTTSTASAPKKRGRPAKEIVTEAEEPPKKRGRPAKAAIVAETAEPKPATKVGTTATPKKRGRPAKAAPAELETEPRRKRGRPPKGGETTKQAEDDEAAADQLEGELNETAEAAEKQEAVTSKRKAPFKSQAKKPANHEAEQTGTSQQYWLMKAEQEDREEKTHDGTVINTKFTIDDLRAKTKPELWDGVRNVVAAKNMRAMKQGDLAFFYASGGKGGRTPGIVGVMEVVSEAEPDVTTANASTYGYVEDEKARNKWVVVGVAFRKKLSHPVSLKELQKYKAAGAVLENMQLFKQSRLSVSKVSKAEWEFIIDELVEGYEADNVANDTVAAADGAQPQSGGTADEEGANGGSEHKQSHDNPETFDSATLQPDGTANPSSEV
ncbi:hypothetical protein BAUCODRAFT_35805 [Baudoinia panamericana UAMH 10762]|uniref:EVE domain-containing protein n=1 Tax=Baudoinia panamericana (strain UAMH 10762) TaxID=717646 RepID=M2N715_BAUPA|nr:uncharacterized protein BAUCODRAFT_35805 [Baudoinia panamericana UAMH 10762]EMC94570.1 hypothetical protein BAUCODRAFT_35805 [Baudoinia panamericana UAMH 10762]